MAPCLSRFPDVCLATIFKHFSLMELIRIVARVCPNWSRLVQSQLKQRHTLILIQQRSDLQPIQTRSNPLQSDLIGHVRREDGSPWAPQLPLHRLEFDSIVVPGRVLSNTFTTGLMAAMPNVTRLTIIQVPTSHKQFHPQVSIKQVIRLIRHWAKELVSLSLRLDYLICENIHVFRYEAYQIVEANAVVLFGLINSLPSLLHLAMDINFPNMSYYLLKRMRLSILAFLKTFSTRLFLGASFENLLVESVQQFAIDNEDIRIDWNLTMTSKNFEALQLHRRLQYKFTRVPIGDIIQEAMAADLQYFCTRFVSLVVLKLDIDMPMSMLARSLAPLAQLIHLELKFWSYLKDEPQMQPQLIVQLASVRMLTLTVVTRSHLETERLYPAQIFPNVQVLRWKNVTCQCVECHYDYGRISRVNHQSDEAERVCGVHRRIEQCASLARQPFERCVNLRVIVPHVDGD